MEVIPNTWENADRLCEILDCERNDLPNRVPMEEDESEEQLDDKELDEIVSCVWTKNGWLYIELNVSELDEQYREKMKQWKYERDEMNDDYFNSRF